MLPCPDSGVAYAVELAMHNDRQQLNVHGSYQVPVRAHHLPDQKILHRFDDGREETVAAVIPVTMAILGLDWLEPLQFDWAVPAYGTALDVGAPARGYFALDALAADDLPGLNPGRYVSYFVLDGNIYGPIMLEVPQQGLPLEG